MRTRTLLLLAVTCGLAILLAGGIQLLRLANQDHADVLGKGDKGTAGDAAVVVDDVAEADGTMTVTVTLSGVDDPEGVDGFTLVGVNGKAVAESGDTAAADACTGFTVEPVQCTLTFPTDRFKGSARQLKFERAAEKVLWKLAD